MMLDEGPYHQDLDHSDCDPEDHGSKARADALADALFEPVNKMFRRVVTGDDCPLSKPVEVSLLPQEIALCIQGLKYAIQGDTNDKLREYLIGALTHELTRGG